MTCPSPEGPPLLRTSGISYPHLLCHPSLDYPLQRRDYGQSIAHPLRNTSSSGTVPASYSTHHEIAPYRESGDTMDKRIGVIGLGVMGGAFARHLVGAGWEVIGFDIEADRNREARAAGVESAHSAEEVAEMAGDVITSLPTARAVLDAATVIARATPPARTVAETSTD